jgi:hypothetical protein
MTEGYEMGERLFDFFDEILQRCFGSGGGSYPRIHRDAVERLLSDDTHGRLAQGRLAAVEWGSSETTGTAAVISERLLITHHGLVYAACLTAPARGRFSRRPLYYLAAPPSLFESVVDRFGAIPLLPVSAAAVDSRLGHDLLYPWPLDAALRRTLDSHPVLRMEPTGV